MKRLLSTLFMAMVFSMMTQGQVVEAFVTELLNEYPKARLLDIYKSCFQDYMGAEHLVSDTASARAYLEQEIISTDIDDLMPWYYEPCGIGGDHVRISLRAVLEGHITADVLLEAFISSANGNKHPLVEDWAEQWHGIVNVIDQMGISINHYEQDKQYIEEVLSQGKYAISHSPEYREAYSPHYRIVRRDIFEHSLRPLLP